MKATREAAEQSSADEKYFADQFQDLGYSEVAEDRLPWLAKGLAYPGYQLVAEVIRDDSASD